jgi:hypothetical protein
MSGLDSSCELMAIVKWEQLKGIILMDLGSQKCPEHKLMFRVILRPSVMFIVTSLFSLASLSLSSSGSLHY